jgi:hypothetical protein
VLDVEETAGLGPVDDLIQGVFLAGVASERNVLGVEQGVLLQGS